MERRIAHRDQLTLLGAVLTSVILLMLEPVLAQQQGSWTYTGSLHAGRADHSGTLLLNGKVLVAGGFKGLAPSPVLSSSELYDPTTGVWETTGPFNIARGGHTATLLHDGKVLVTGGCTSVGSCEPLTSSAELYDLQTGNWSLTGSLSTPSYGETATLLPDGKVLVAGGGNLNSAFNRAEIYNPNTGQWSVTDHLIAARMFHTATLLRSGKVLVTGGTDHVDYMNNTESALSSAEIFNPDTGKWSSTGSLSTARHGHTGTLLPSGKVLVATGADNNLFFVNSTELYDPDTETWSGSGRFPLPCGEILAATLLNSGDVLFTGCFNWDIGNLIETPVYSSSAGTWSVAGRLNAGRNGHTSTLLPDGRVLVAGGFGDPTSISDVAALASAEIYVPGPGDFFVPIVLSSAGAVKGVFYTSEITLTNRSAQEAHVEFTYTAAFGGGSGTATTTLEPGGQRIVPDAIEYLKSLGIPIPASGNRGGSLGVRFSGLSSSSEGAINVRITTEVPGGRAGLAYGGIPTAAVLSEPSLITGLRNNATDRSNVAVQNAGGLGEGDVTLRLTVFSGDPSNPVSQVLPDITLAAGGFSQINSILHSNGLDLSNGYVGVERVSGTAPYYAYGVINDQANSDGSFIPPIPYSSLTTGTIGLTLPVIVEAGTFTTELMLTNLSTITKKVNFTFVSDAVSSPGNSVSFSRTLQPHEQEILPSLIQFLRDTGHENELPVGPAYVGPLFATVEGSVSGIALAARTSAPGGGGRYGLYYTAVPYGSASTGSVWLYGLQQNSENRSNLAIVNTGESDGNPDIFQIDLFNGETGQKVATVQNVTVNAKRWLQIGTILAVRPGTTQGYARITRISGSNPFISYAVINDGGQPGQRTGDGAYVASSPCGLQVERGYLKAPTGYRGCELQSDWDWHRLLAALRPKSPMEKELKRLLKEGFKIHAGSWEEDRAHFSSADFPGV